MATTVLTALAAAGLLLTACSGQGSPEPSGEAETVRVGYFPLAHTSTVVNAENEGLFEAEGLSVELVQTEGGATAITALTSGALDIIYTNYTSALLAASQGLPIRLVAANDVGADDHGIFVAADSGITGAADLVGKTFAVNNLQNIGTLAVYSLMTDAGLDPTAVNLVEMPYPDMQAALERGSVDAIWQVEPFQARAESAGLVRISNMFTGSLADVPVAGWITTEQFAADNPEAIAQFQRAIAASAEQLSADNDKLVELVPTFTQVSPEVAAAITLPTFQTELDLPALQLSADLMKQYGIIDADLDVNSLVAG
ncbi:ABC transporter substrate-binding protein [Microbacterium foliorum]